MSEQKQPLVTVVIPCHNHAQWINQAIDSVLAQDYQNKQLVVVDDGSSDGSHDVVERRLSCLDDVMGGGVMGLLPGGVPLKLLRIQSPRGPSFARNCGIRTGWEGTDLFGFLDSDDMYAPQKLSKSVERWLLCPEHIGAVYSDFETLNDSTGVRVREFKEPFGTDRLVRECLPNMDSLVNKVVFETCGLFDEQMRTCEDYDLWMRISERYIILHVPEALVTVRVGSHSSTATVSKPTWEKNWKRVMEKARSRRGG